MRAHINSLRPVSITLDVPAYKADGRQIVVSKRFPSRLIILYNFLSPSVGLERRIENEKKNVSFRVAPEEIGLLLRDFLDQ